VGNVSKKKSGINSLLFVILILLVAYVIYVNLDRFSFDGTSLGTIDISPEENTGKEMDYAPILNSFFCPEEDCNYNLDYYLSQSTETKCAIYDVDLPWFYKEMKDKNIFLVTDDVQYGDVFDDFNSDMKKLLLELRSKGKIKTDVRENDYMHNKFCVFNIADVKSVWVGSANFTTNDFFYNNNNVIVFDELNYNKVPDLFEKEFDEMWRGTFNGGNENPIPATYPKVYFCPEDDCSLHYSEVFDLADKNIFCMFFDFTHDVLGEKLISLKKEKGLDIKVIFETRQAGSQYSEFEKLQAAGIKVIKDKNPKTMHNKFCVIDSNYLITGSMNPSKHSDTANDESIIIINSQYVIDEYLDYFEKYWEIWS